MKRYIKINNNNFIIIKIFTWYVRPEFDGTEIELDDNGPDLKINGKNILNEYDFPIFIYTNGIVIERTQSEIDNDPDFIIYYKKLKKEELNRYVGDNLLDVIKPGIRSLEDIVTAWNSFKTNASSWTTKQQIDNAFDTAINWLNS